MVNQVGRRCHFLRELGNVKRPAHVLKVAARFQLFAHGENVNRLLRESQALNGVEHQLVPPFVEAVGLEYVADHGISVALNHQCAEHCLFKVDGLRLQAAEVVFGRGFGAAFSCKSPFLCFGHVVFR